MPNNSLLVLVVIAVAIAAIAMLLMSFKTKIAGLLSGVSKSEPAKQPAAPAAPGSGGAAHSDCTPDKQQALYEGVDKPCEVKLLQTMVDAEPDGIFGPATRGKLNQYTQARGAGVLSYVTLAQLEAMSDDSSVATPGIFSNLFGTMLPHF